MTDHDKTVPDGWTGTSDGDVLVTTDGRCSVWQSIADGHAGEWYAEVNHTPDGFDYQYFPTRAEAVVWCETTARAIPAE